MAKAAHSRFKEFIFYGNYFYGVCAVATAIEAQLQQGQGINGLGFYALIFVATVLYYNYPYARKYNFSQTSDPRTAWYIRNYNFVRWNQLAFTFILGIAGTLFVLKHFNTLLALPLWLWALALTFPAAAGLYYGGNVLSRRYNLRSIGWLKPFIIGFTWAGLVAFYPVLYNKIVTAQPYILTQRGIMLFLKNMMFVAVLCIMFDVKDYAADSARQLRTFVVRIGLRKTIFNILLPLSVLGLLTFWSYAITQSFSAGRVLFNTIPFLLLMFAAASLRRHRKLMYYLVVIDGLLLVKAMCGIIAWCVF